MTQEWVPVQPETPELDRMIERATAGHSQDIGEFIEWLGENGFVIATRDAYDELLPMLMSTEGWLAQYFGIDLQKVEQERAAVLAYVRSKNDTELAV